LLLYPFSEDSVPGIDARTVFWVSLGAVCLILIAAFFTYLHWQDIQRWRYRDARRWADAQHVEVALPLDGKEAAFTCGKLLKLDKAGISKLDVLERMRQVARDSGFSDEEIKESGSLLGETAYMGYVWAFMTFDKPLQSVKMQFDDVVKKNIDSFLNKLSSEERKQIGPLLPRINQMQLRAFDLGRRDARLSPCPY
jgi:hypothetical protein